MAFSHFSSLCDPLSSHLCSLGPRSPASYTRGSQESANTTPRSSIKPSQPLLEAHPAERRSRFSHADAPGHRQSESRDVGMRRVHTDDVSHSARYVDDIPSSRSMSDVRGDDDTPISDAQRTSLSHPVQHPSSSNVDSRICTFASFILFPTSISRVRIKQKNTFASTGRSFLPWDKAGSCTTWRWSSLGTCWTSSSVGAQKSAYESDSP